MELEKLSFTVEQDIEDNGNIVNVTDMVPKLNPMEKNMKANLKMTIIMVMVC